MLDARAERPQGGVQTEYREQRTAMLQDWADMIDEWTLKRPKAQAKGWPPGNASRTSGMASGFIDPLRGAPKYHDFPQATAMEK